MRYHIKRCCNLLLIAALLNTAACGYLIYPERQGLRGDRVDGTVVVLDAIGLLFFVLPGVVAFAVDFSTGCIYLPKGNDGPFSMEAQPDSTSEEWVPVAQVAPFADDATIAAALRDYLSRGNLNVSSAHIEWRPASMFTTAVAHVSTTPMTPGVIGVSN